MPLWLLGIGGWLKEAAGVALGWITRYPWQTATIAALCLAAWALHGKQKALGDLADRIAAEKAASGSQQRVNAAAETHYKEVANVADTKHEDMVAEAFDATQRYIAEHRVQPQDRTCKAPAPAASSGPVVPPEVPAGVVVGEADVHACADLYAYSVSAHDWAQSLKLPENLLPEK